MLRLTIGAETMPSAAARSRVMRYRKTRATAISALNLALPFGQHGLINELPNYLDTARWRRQNLLTRDQFARKQSASLANASRQ